MNKKTSKILFVIPALLVLATVIDCGGGNSSTTGFSVNATNWAQGFDGQLHLVGGTSFHADWQFDNGSANGQNKHGFGFTNPTAWAPVNDGRVPARWQILPDTGQPIDPTMYDVVAGARIKVRGRIFQPFLLANPDSIDLSSPA